MTGISTTSKSTIVRAERLRRFVLALSEREAPRLGARLAVRMWMTLPASPAAGRAPLAAPGDRAVLEAGVVTESWGDGPAVYLMHGWGGYRGQLGAFVAPLTEAGFRVVALDAPGHGESGPGMFGRGRALMPDFINALRTAMAHYGAAHGVIAHSLGASAVAIATLDGLTTNRLVLIAPVSNVMSGIDIFSRAAGVGPRVRAQMPRRIERIARMPASHFDIALRAAEDDELPPALVIHDAGDKQVPFDNGALVAAAWPDARLERTEGLGHLRILRDPAVLSSVTGFVTGVSRQATAGADPEARSALR
jgi:pimeloyl-ACP methyl ester carboxylesterase